MVEKQRVANCTCSTIIFNPVKIKYLSTQNIFYKVCIFELLNKTPKIHKTNGNILEDVFDTLYYCHYRQIERAQVCDVLCMMRLRSMVYPVLSNHWNNCKSTIEINTLKL